ncbi:MAG: hypothetical protein COA42_24455 [Alteromonadaceae bacterium]|nr:MAG: hypothetical protein COA42_24455 [Alteromonadaceae bacterium]
MNKVTFALSTVIATLSLSIDAKTSHPNDVTDEVISTQRQHLAENTKDKGFGPQSPRDINATKGKNHIVFGAAPSYKQMNLCNIHFHRGAEHSGGQYTTYAGNGDGHGYGTGYLYSGKLNKKEIAPVGRDICPSKHGSLKAGDTIEIHYVHSSAQVKPGPTLGACLSDAINNPQLRVEAQVYVLVNDSSALDFTKLTKLGQESGFSQALNMPTNTGTPVVYSGSTTGPGFNKTGSPFQVTWSVHPNVAKVNIESVGKWCKGNTFDEDHAHGVRNLVTNPDLLSPIK